MTRRCTGESLSGVFFARSRSEKEKRRFRSDALSIFLRTGRHP